MTQPSSKREPSSALARERRRQIRGLLLLAGLILLASIARSGVARVFTPGWWRLW